MLEVIQQRKLVGSPLWDLSTDEENAAIHKIIHDRPLNEVMEESKKVFDELVEAIETFDGTRIFEGAGAHTGLEVMGDLHQLMQG